MNELLRAERPAANVWNFQRQVRWGECDPAGVVYTPRFADFVAEAHLAFFHHLFGGAPYEMLLKDQLALPAKAISIEFKKSLRPNEWFDVEVCITDIRTRTYDLGMTAKSSEGVALFSAKLTLICLDRRITKAVALPEFIRNRLVAFRGEDSAEHERPSL